MHRLGDELSEYHGKVLLTSLTRANIEAPHPVRFISDLNGSSVAGQFTTNNPLYLMHRGDHPQKLLGLKEEELVSLLAVSDVALCECDGSKNLPLKQHNDRDPVAPDYSSHIIVVVGADSVGMTIGSGRVHRPELFAKMWNVGFNDELDAELVAEVVTSKVGYMSKVRPNQRVSYYVNKSDINRHHARDLASAIASIAGDVCYVGSLRAGGLERVE